MGTAEKMKAKIAKLLAKAESTTFPEERDALTAKATHLMIEMGIDAAELEAAGEVKPEDIVEAHRVFKTRGFAPVWVTFASELRRGFGDLQSYQSRGGSSQYDRAWYVVGHKTDVENFLVLLDSVILQAGAALGAYRKENREIRRYQTGNDKYLAERTFLLAFASACSRRLTEMRTTVRQETNVSAGAELVLASKQDRVDSYMGATHNLKSSRGMRRGGSWAAAEAGSAAGRRADLGGNRLANDRDQIAS